MNTGEKRFEQGDQEVKELGSLIECVIGAAIEVHRQQCRRRAAGRHVRHGRAESHLSGGHTERRARSEERRVGKECVP